jgi:hypothetical protein
MPISKTQHIVCTLFSSEVTISASMRAPKNARLPVVTYTF